MINGQDMAVTQRTNDPVDWKTQMVIPNADVACRFAYEKEYTSNKNSPRKGSVPLPAPSSNKI